MDDLAETSRRTIEQGSKSFAAAARLFDPKTRKSAYMLYAWCRYCDDQVDGQVLGLDGSAIDTTTSRARLETIRRETSRALVGKKVKDPAFAALQYVVEQNRIPERYPFEHLDGFAMDVEGREYQNLDDTIRYCYHVAGVVGIMMAYVMGVRDEPTLERAMDLGIAFQLTNIARDVMDDARMGRVYLPGNWLAQAGVPPEQIQEIQQRPRVFGVAKRMLEEAERYYDSASVGIRRLPFRSAWAIATAKEVYRDIGRILKKRGAEAWGERASTSRSRKLFLASKGAVEAFETLTFGSRSEARSRSGLWRFKS
jgi:phytoene synthase